MNKERVKVKFRLCRSEFSQHYLDVRVEVKVSCRVFMHSALQRNKQSRVLPDRYNPCKRTVFSLDRKQNGPQNRSGRGGEEKNVFTGRESNPEPRSSARSLIIVLSFAGP